MGFTEDAIAWAAQKEAEERTAESARDQGCADKARLAEADLVAAHDAMGLAWMKRPSTLYTIGDVEKLYAQTLFILSQVANSLKTQIDANAWGRDDMRSQLTLVVAKSAEGAPFLQAVKDARALGKKAIDAPGLRRWVLRSMDEAGTGIFVIAISACKAPWWYGVLATIAGMAKALIATVKNLAVAVVDVAEQILTVPDKIGSLFTALKWTAFLGGGAFLAWRGHKFYKQRRGLPVVSEG